MRSQSIPAAPALRALGPYRVGEQPIAGIDRVLYRGTDTTDESPVLITVTKPAPRTPQAARALVAELAHCEQLAAPLALARRDEALLVVDAVPGGAPDDSGPTTGPVPREQYRVAVRDLALAVEALHAHGLAHGAIDAWSIQLDATGGLRLRGAAAGIDLGVRSAQTDRDAVADILLALAPGDADESLIGLMPALRRSSTGLRDLVDAASVLLGSVAPAAPEPQLVPPERHLRSAVEPTDAAPRVVRRQGPRHAAPVAPIDRRLIAGGVVILLVAVLAAVVAWPRVSAQQQPDSSIAAAHDLTDAQTSAAWLERMNLLYAARADAFSAAEPARLNEVYTPGSRQLYADAETIESLRAQQRQVIGFAPRLLQIESVEVFGSTANVVVLDEIDEFSIRDATGTLMPVAGRAAARTTFVLQHTEGGWLIEQAHRTVE